MCDKVSSSGHAGESLAYPKPNQQDRAESCGEAGNYQPNHRQEGCRLQAERLNGLRLENVDKVGSPHFYSDGRQEALQPLMEGSNEAAVMVRLWRTTKL